MKTIKELNSKIWYRFIKVVYVIFFVILLSVSVISFVSQYGSHFDKEKSYIKCADGARIGIEKLNENYIYLYSDNISDYNDKKIENLCKSSYSLVSVYTERNWSLTIAHPFLAIIIMYLIFELIRRIFYYIILGSFTPDFKRKDNSSEDNK